MILLRRFQILIGIFFIIIFLLTGCANVTRIEKDSIVAFGECLDDADEPFYYLIRIDVNKTVDKSILYSRVKLTHNAPDMSMYRYQYLHPSSP
jgi:hypothetical protein